eukprot:1797443-Alexandrium_andersonii.AAC.1
MAPAKDRPDADTEGRTLMCCLHPGLTLRGRGTRRTMRAPRSKAARQSLGILGRRATASVKANT